MLAAAKGIQIYKPEPVIGRWRAGTRLQGIRNPSMSITWGIQQSCGKPCALVYATLDAEKRSSQSFRTLFLQETIKRGILAPSFVVSYCHTDADIDRTVEAVHEALHVYRRALNEGIEKYLIGRSVKPVFRRYA